MPGVAETLPAMCHGVEGRVEQVWPPQVMNLWVCTALETGGGGGLHFGWAPGAGWVLYQLPDEVAVACRNSTQQKVRVKNDIQEREMFSIVPVIWTIPSWIQHVDGVTWAVPCGALWGSSPSSASTAALMAVRRAFFDPGVRSLVSPASTKQPLETACAGARSSPKTSHLVRVLWG